jgi:lambda repressor-like predicted transcriptional regulator
LKAAVITDEVYVEIELLRKHGMSLRKIAEEVGCAVDTGRSHLAAEGLPRYARKKEASD